jgi:hypothetical protein
MSDGLIVAILGLLQIIIGSYFTYLIAKARNEIKEVHIAVNSRVDLLLASIEALSRVRAQRVRARAAARVAVNKESA